MASAIRFINHHPHSPFTSGPVVNYSIPVFDLYHQIPQLNSYQTFKPPVYQPSYHHTFPPKYNIPTPLASSNVNLHPGSNPDLKSQSLRDEGSINKPHRVSEMSQKFNRRDGWGWGGSGYGNGGKGGVGQSPAIAALSLLGFLFYLNLIQSSLQNNRNMLTTTTTTTTTNTTTSNMMTTGTTGTTVVGRNGRVRRRRGFGYNERRLTSDSIPTHPNRQVQEFLHNKEEDIVKQVLPRERSSQRGWEDHRDIKARSATLKQRLLYKPSPIQYQNRTGTLFSTFKRLSVNCIQLLACNMGRSVFSDIGPTAGFMMRMMGDRILPRSTKTKGDWKNRIMRALNDGWRSRRNCSRIYKQCPMKNILRSQKASTRNAWMTRRFQASKG